MCGVLALFDSEEVIGKMYSGLLTLQHRGQDAAGILTYDGRYHLKKGNGLIRDIFDEHNVTRLRGYIGLGHTRYPTVGEGTSEDAQPFWINHPYGIAAVHNGNDTDFAELVRELFEKSRKMTNSTNDVEVILNVFSESLQRSLPQPLTPDHVFAAVRHVFAKVRGAYSVVFHIAGQGMVAFRDPYGIRPLLMGTNQEKLLPSFGFASESVSLDTLGFTEIRDVPPGTAIFIDMNRKVTERRLIKAPFRPCIFEYVYFARPDSTLNGINVSLAREELGAKLAQTIRRSGLPIDVVVPVPDSSRTSAIEIARKLKLKYSEGLVKNRYIGRTFIMPGDSLRQKSIRQKINPIVDVFRGKKVLIVDDSIVRGNTSRSIIEMVRGSGADKVYFASYSAPLTNPCVYGIDMQTRREFIAKDSTAEQIAAKIGADAVIYQEIPAMERAVRRLSPSIHQFCKACFTGVYPTRDVSPGMLEQIERERDSFLPVRQQDLNLPY